MSKQKAIREQIATKIVDALKAGTAPWRRPWRNDLTNTGSPANAVSGKVYRGINALLLGLTAYSCRWWATYAQVQSLGGRVKKGERATRIVYWRQVERVAASKDGHELIETFPLLRTYCIFNMEQCEGKGIEKYVAQPCTARPFADYEPAERVIAATEARIEFGGSKAVYYPDEDFIRLPPKQAFESQKEYYSTVLHELLHWSGHESRLNRLAKNSRFGDSAYCLEELCAEIGSSFLCAEIGIPLSGDLSNHAAYLASWLNVLQADSSAIFTATSQANQAVDYIMSFSRMDQAAGEESQAVMTGAER